MINDEIKLYNIVITVGLKKEIEKPELKIKSYTQDILNIAFDDNTIFFSNLEKFEKTDDYIRKEKLKEREKFENWLVDEIEFAHYKSLEMLGKNTSLHLDFKRKKEILEEVLKTFRAKK